MEYRTNLVQAGFKKVNLLGKGHNSHVLISDTILNTENVKEIGLTIFEQKQFLDETTCLMLNMIPFSLRACLDFRTPNPTKVNFFAHNVMLFGFSIVDLYIQRI